MGDGPASVRRRFGSAIVAAIAVGALATATPASGATEIGTTFDPGASFCGNMLLQSVSPPDDSYAVPSREVITSWSYQASTGPVQIKLKVGREESLTSFTITDESAVETAAAAKLNTFATRLPVEADEVIGLTPVTNGLPCVRGMATGYSYSAYVMGSDVPPGTTATFNPPQAGTQIDIAATLEVDSDLDGFGDESQDRCLTIRGPDHGCPSNDFSFDRVKRNTRNGTATLAVIVPNPGDIRLSGKGLVKVRGATVVRAHRAAAKVVADAGKVVLKVRAKGRRKGKLNRTGSVKVRPKVTYTPSGGKPDTRTKRVKLIKKATEGVRARPVDRP